MFLMFTRQKSSELTKIATFLGQINKFCNFFDGLEGWNRNVM